MGRKTNSISLRLKKTNKDYIHCMYGDILYAHIFKNSIKMQKTYIDIFKTIDIPCPQWSLTGGYKKANVYVLYLDPRSRAVLSEKFNIKSRFYRRAHVFKNFSKSTDFEKFLSKNYKKAGELLRESAHLSIYRATTTEGSIYKSIKKRFLKKKEGCNFTPSSYFPHLFLDKEKKENTIQEKGYLHKGAYSLCFLKNKPKYTPSYKVTKPFDYIYAPGLKKNHVHDFFKNILLHRFLETGFFTKQKNHTTHLQNSYNERFLQEKNICLAFLKVYTSTLFFNFYKYGVFLSLCTSIKNKHIFFGQKLKEILPVKAKTPPLYKYLPFKGLYIECFKKNIYPEILENRKTYIRNFSNSLKKGWGNRVSISFIKSTNEKACALFLAHYVSYFLERKVLFRHIKQQLSISLSSLSLYKKRKKGGMAILALPSYGCAQKICLPVGIRICCSGRVGSRSKKAQRSRKDTYMWGETGLHVFSNMLDFAKTHAETSFGTVGIQVWVCYKKV